MNPRTRRLRKRHRQHRKMVEKARHFGNQLGRLLTKMMDAQSVAHRVLHVVPIREA